MKYEVFSRREFWGRIQRISTSWNIKDFLGEISGDNFSKYLCRETLTFSGGDFWGQFQQIFMSWNIKHFLGKISGVEFSDYLCRGILGFLWGRVLGTIPANILCLGIWNMFWGNFLEVPLVFFLVLSVSVCRAAARKSFEVSKWSKKISMLLNKFK